MEEVSERFEERRSTVPRPALRRSKASCAGWSLCLKTLAFRDNLSLHPFRTREGPGCTEIETEGNRRERAEGVKSLIPSVVFHK